MMKLFVTIWFQGIVTYGENSSNLDNIGIAYLPLHDIVFSFHEKIGSTEEDKELEDSSISHTSAFFFFYLCARNVI